MSITSSTDLAVDVVEGYCCICLMSLDTSLGRQTLPCGHTLHEQCVTQMRQRGASGRCPICRQAHKGLRPVQALIDRATAYYQRSNQGKCRQKCVEILEEVLSIDPENMEASSVLGEMCFDDEGHVMDVDHALHLLNLAQKQGSSTATVSLGDVHKQQGNLQDALVLWEKARLMGNSCASIRLGNHYRDQGDTTKAEMMYEAAHHDGNYKGTLGLGNLHQYLGNLVTARQLYEDLRSRGHLEGTCELAALYERNGNAERCLEMYDEAHRKGSLQATVLLGFEKCAQYDDDEALALFEEGRRRGHPRAAYVLMCVFNRRGEYANAVKMHEEARRNGFLHYCGGKLSCDLMEVQSFFPFLDFNIGAQVQIHDLTSAEGRLMNGQFGRIVCGVSQTGRYGVEILATGSWKAIKLENLYRVFEDIAAGRALDQPCMQAVGPLSSSTRDVNAQLSDALLRSRPAEHEPKVILLAFSRSPTSYRNILLTSTALADWRQNLSDSGHSVELESGAKVFVRPEHYESVLEAIRLAGWVLFPRHVIVDPQVETTVIDLVMSLSENIYPRASNAVPLAFSNATSKMERKPSIERTFITFRMPSSMLSSNCNGPCTVSTTATSARKGQNHRRG